MSWSQPITFWVENTRTTLDFCTRAQLDDLDVALSFQAQDPELVAARDDDDDGGGWDGRMRFLRRPKKSAPWIPTGLVPRAIRAIEARGEQWQIEDKRRPPDADIPRYLEPIPLFDYQREAVDRCMRFHRGVVVMAPRAGKTRTFFELVRRVDQDTLWVAPTREIAEQTARGAREWFAEDDVVVVSGKKTYEHAQRARLTICTAAALLTLPDPLLQSRRCLVLDEFHHFVATGGWAKVIKDKMDHVYYRFGATGTHFRSGGDDMALEAVLSTVIYEKTSADLLKLGRLVPTDVVFLPVDAPQIRASGAKWHGGGVGTKGIHEHEYRNALVASAAHHLHMTGRKVLVVVETLPQGIAVERLLNEHLPPPPALASYRTAEFVHGKRKGWKNILAAFNADQEVKVLVGTSVIGEGIDLPPADAMVWARGGKAPVTLLQGWFRVCTASPGKERAVIVDFADRHHKTLMRHSTARLEIAYYEPIFDVRILPTPQDLGHFLSTRSPSTSDHQVDG